MAEHTWWPAWALPYFPRPWVLENEVGQWYRHPPEGRMHKAYVFKTPEDALSFARRQQLRLLHKQEGDEQR